MIRFIDLRYQGLQARFAFFDTVPDEPNRLIVREDEILAVVGS